MFNNGTQTKKIIYANFLLTIFLLFLLCSRPTLAADEEVDIGGGWIFVKETDSMTDQNRSYIEKSSQKSESGIFFFQCTGNGFYQPGWEIEGNFSSDGKYMYRFDRKKPVELSVENINFAGSAIYFHNDKNEVGTFIFEALQSKRLVIRWEAFGQILEDTFDLSAFGTALEYIVANSPKCP